MKTSGLAKGGEGENVGGSSAILRTSAGLGYGTIGFVILALIAMIVRYRRETPVGRRQWRWAMIGFVIGTAIQIGPGQIYSNYLGSPAAQASFGVALWSWILTPLNLSASLTIIATGVMLSVLRYRLYDTQAAVSRSILYGALTLALLAIFAGSEKIIEIVGEDYFGESLGALAGGARRGLRGGRDLTPPPPHRPLGRASLPQEPNTSSS